MGGVVGEWMRGEPGRKVEVGGWVGGWKGASDGNRA